MMSKQWVETLGEIKLDKKLLIEWLSQYLKDKEESVEPTLYYRLTSSSDCGETRALYNNSYVEKGVKCPRWVVRPDGKMVPGWLDLDFEQQRVFIDLSYCKEGQIYHPLDEVYLRGDVSGYMREVFSDFLKKGVVLCQGWLAGFKPGAFYRQHIHTFPHCYNSILHLPIVTGKDYELRFHAKEGQVSFREFEAGRAYVVDPRVWHSAQFTGDYIRWHACFHMYDLRGLSKHSICPEKIFRAHQEQNKVWKSYMSGLDRPSRILWDDQLLGV